MKWETPSDKEAKTKMDSAEQKNGSKVVKQTMKLQALKKLPSLIFVLKVSPHVTRLNEKSFTEILSAFLDDALRGRF